MRRDFFSDLAGTGCLLGQGLQEAGELDIKIKSGDRVAPTPTVKSSPTKGAPKSSPGAPAECHDPAVCVPGLARIGGCGPT